MASVVLLASTFILVCMLSRVWFFATPWTIHKAPLSMEFPRQEYWSGLPFASPGNLPNPGVETACLASPALAGIFFYHWATLEGQINWLMNKIAGVGLSLFLPSLSQPFSACWFHYLRALYATLLGHGHGHQQL